MKFLVVGDERTHVRRDVQGCIATENRPTEMTGLRVDFCRFANAPKMLNIWN